MPIFGLPILDPVCGLIYHKSTTMTWTRLLSEDFLTPTQTKHIRSSYSLCFYITPLCSKQTVNMACACISDNALRWISFSGSLLSVLLGISHIIYGFTMIPFATKKCAFYECNASWRGLISFAPETFLDTFQPIILGGIGVFYSLPVGFRPTYPACLSPPSSSALGGLFHIIMALFGNLGYMFWVGIAFASYNLILGVAFIFINLVNKRDQRPKDLDEIPTPAAPPATSIEVTKIGQEPIPV